MPWKPNAYLRPERASKPNLKKSTMRLPNQLPDGFLSTFNHGIESWHLGTAGWLCQSIADKSSPVACCIRRTPLTIWTSRPGFSDRCRAGLRALLRLGRRHWYRLSSASMERRGLVRGRTGARVGSLDRTVMQSSDVLGRLLASQRPQRMQIFWRLTSRSSGDLPSPK